MNSRSTRTILTVLFSLAVVVLVFVAVDWRNTIDLFRENVAPMWLVPFLVIAALIAIAYALRWRMLVGLRLRYLDTMIATILTLGGNMIIPARGGDLLRVHHTRKSTQGSYAEVIGALVTEKIVDLLSLIFLAAVILPLAFAPADFGVVARLNPLTVTYLLAAILIVSASAFSMARHHRSAIFALLTAISQRLHVTKLLETHLTPFLSSTNDRLALSSIAGPVLISIVLWLVLYAPSYIVVGRFVGIELTYLESLVVLIAGVVSLLIPAAPSGLGTFHASVTTSYALLGRPADEGLLLATAIHFLFFCTYVAATCLVLLMQRLRPCEL